MGGRAPRGKRAQALADAPGTQSEREGFRAGLASAAGRQEVGFHMDEDGSTQYFRKKRGPYSGMMLQSLYWVLRGAIVVVVVIGLLAMFSPLL